MESIAKNKAIQDAAVKALSKKAISNSQTSTVSDKSIISQSTPKEKVIGFLDRVMPTPIYPSSSVISRKANSILTSESIHVLQGKQALLQFCAYFQHVPLDQLEKDPTFIYYIKKLSEKDSSIYTRAFQLALEGVYSKRYFNEADIVSIFKGILSIVDIIGTNEGKIDSSTLFSVFQTDYLTRQPDFRNNTELRVVVSTCIKSDNLKDITNPSIRKFIFNSQASTGNTVNDILIDGHHYDFKITPKPEYRQNHIIFLDYHEINVGAAGRRYLHNLHENFEAIMNENTQHPYNIEYIKEAKKQLKNIMNNPSSNTLNKIQEWNSWVYTFNKRPHTVYFPILVPIDTKPFTADPNLINDFPSINLPISKSLDTKPVLNAVQDIIDRKDPITRHKAYIHSKGVIGEKIDHETKEVD